MSKTSKKNQTSSEKKNCSTDSEDSDFENKISKISVLLRENYKQQKKLMEELHQLRTLHKKEIKKSSKSLSRSNTGKNAGFNKPLPVPSNLKKLLDIKEDVMSRSQVTRLMYEYFRKNNMYNTNTKKEIIPNDKIKKIFGMQKGDEITFYNLQTWLKKVYNESANNIKEKVN